MDFQQDCSQEHLKSQLLAERAEVFLQIVNTNCELESTFDIGKFVSMEITFLFMYLEKAVGKKATFLSVTNINDRHIKYSKQKPWSKQNQHLFLIHLFTRLLHGFHKRTHTRDT